MFRFDELFSVSDVGAVCGNASALFSMKSRIAAFERNFDFCSKVPDFCSEGWQRRCEDALFHLRSLVSRLDSTSLIDHTVEVAGVIGEYRALGSLAEHTAEVFGPDFNAFRSPSSEPWIVNCLEKLKERGQDARVREARWRLEEEIVDAAKSGWFVIFNTLTVKEHFYDEVFSVGSTKFRDYIRGVSRAVGSEIYGSVRKSEQALSVGEDFHRYFAVVERGSRSGRLHIHVVHLCRDIPWAWKSDPNRGRELAKYREIDKMRLFWRYGFSSPIACRFLAYDAFAKIGWRWPVVWSDEIKDFIPVDAKPPRALARYVSKYLAKSYASEKGSYQWRIRMSRQFGKKRLTKIIARLSSDQLKWMLTRDPMPLIPEWTIPKRILKLSLLKEMVVRLRDTNSRNIWRQWIEPKSLKVMRPRQSIVERWRGIIRGRTTINPLRTGPSVRDIWTAMVVCDIKREFEIFRLDDESAYVRGGVCHA